MHKVEKQGYKSCVSLMKLADRYSTERLEDACIKKLSYTPSLRLKNIATILKNGQNKFPVVKVNPSDNSAQYGITRGGSYFKGVDRS